MYVPRTEICSNQTSFVYSLNLKLPVVRTLQIPPFNSQSFPPGILFTPVRLVIILKMTSTKKQERLL